MTVLHIIRSEIASILAKPYMVRREIASNTVLRVDCVEPHAVADATRIVRWQEWGRGGTYGKAKMFCWKQRSRYGNHSVEKDALANITREENVDDWECDICDVEALSASKSPIEDYTTLDVFAEHRTPDYVKSITLENLEAMLAHDEIRIISRDSTSDSFEWCQWDGRVALLNSGGSHHFAAARYIAKHLNKPVPLRGAFRSYWLNPMAIDSICSEYEMFLVNPMGLYGQFREAMDIFNAEYCIHWLPRPFDGVKLLLLPRCEKRSMIVATVFREEGYYDFGAYLQRLKDVSANNVPPNYLG